MKPAEGLYIFFAEPPIVFFHALHVLAEDNFHEFIDQAIRWFIEKIHHGRRRAAEYRLVLLDEDIGSGKGSQKTKPFHVLSQEIASWPRVLCHRDFHSRNLMLHEGELFWIDFQDARMGPATYDLASLLRDAYLDVPEELQEDLKERFRQKAVPEEPREVFRRRFDLMCVQRNLKALGTFGYQAAARGNPVYLQYIPRTLKYVRDNLEKHARFARLREIPGVTCVEPKGAFYAFPDLGAFIGKKTPEGKKIENDVQLCEWLIEAAKVAVVMGSAFGAPGFVRLSYATSMKNVEEGVRRLAETLPKLT